MSVRPGSMRCCVSVTYDVIGSNEVKKYISLAIYLGTKLFDKMKETKFSMIMSY